MMEWHILLGFKHRPASGASHSIVIYCFSAFYLKCAALFVCSYCGQSCEPKDFKCQFGRVTTDRSQINLTISSTHPGTKSVNLESNKVRHLLKGILLYVDISTILLSIILLIKLHSLNTFIDLNWDSYLYAIQENRNFNLSHKSSNYFRCRNQDMSLEK